MKLTIHTDGGARGNPGPAAVGVVIEGDESSVISQQNLKVGKLKTLVAVGKAIGETTNNVAEYTGVVEALAQIKNLKSKIPNGEPLMCDFYLDSTLIVNQLNGMFKVKDARLRELLSRIRILESEVGGSISYTAIPREQNRRADFLVNRALDRGSAF